MLAAVKGRDMSRVLIIQLARFGDVLQTARLIASLSLQGEVHLCVDTSLASLASLAFPNVTVHSLPAHAQRQNTDAASVLCACHNTLRHLRGLHVDAVYNLNYSGMNRALAALFPPEIQHGHRVVNGQPLREKWIRFAFRWTRDRRAAPLNLVDFWGHFTQKPVAGEAVNPPAVPGGRGLGVVLAGRHARRSLPPEVLGPCVHAVFERLGGPDVFLFGGQAERPIGRALTACLPAHMQDRVRNLAGRTDWPGLVEAMRGLDLLLTPDTGSMHLAARLGVPVEALFLSSAWAYETGPYGLGHRIWQAMPPCAPCLESAGCIADMTCLAPFRSRWFLRALAGQPALMPPPADLCALDTTFDPLGLVLHPVGMMPADPAASSRAQLRGLLTQYIAARAGQNFSAPSAHSTPSLALADTFYQEADWMLPDVTP